MRRFVYGVLMHQNVISLVICYIGDETHKRLAASHGATHVFVKSNHADDKRHLKFLCRDEDFTLHGVKLDMHGDQGANGARGGIKQFARSGLNAVIGHGHTPRYF